MKLVKSRPFRVSSLKSSRGFSLIELVVAMVVALILAAIAIPNIVATYSQYRLGVQATLIADQLDLLRMNAIRRNTTIVLNSTTAAPCSTGANTVLYIDVNKDNACNAGDPRVMLPGDIQIANAGGATPAGMPGSTSMGTAYATTLPLPSAGFSFTSNGTITGATGPYFIVIGYTNSTKYGYRAITVTPMGEIRVWTASSGGSWHASS